MEGFAKYKKHYNPNWETETGFRGWLTKCPTNLLTKEKEAYCKWCAKPLRAHKTDLKKHANSGLHNMHAKNHNSKTVKKITQLGFINNRSQKEADIKIALHVVCHSAIHTVDHLTTLMKNLGTGSIMENLRLHKTKCSKLIGNVISPAFLSDLIEDVGDKPYSIILDESTSLGTAKYMAYCIRYYSENLQDITLDYLGFSEVTEATAIKLAQDFMIFIEKIGLKIDNLISIGTDGANNMCGSKHSLFTELKKRVPHLVLVKCVCHSLDLCASKASQELPCHLEYMIRETRSWFNHSPLRQQLYTELYKAINADKNPASLNKLCDTRWLAWALPTKSTVDQWIELRTHFQIAAGADKSSKCYVARELAKMYSDDANLLYFLFLNEILPDVNSLNKSFQSSNIDITQLYGDMRILLLSMLNRFIKQVYLNNRLNQSADNVDYMLHERDIEMAKEALDHASFDINFNSSLLPLDSIDFGSSFKEYSDKKNIPSETLTFIKERCTVYLIRLCKELIERIPRNLKVISSLRYLNPHLILNNSSAGKNFNFLPWELAAQECDKSLLQSQWRRLCALRLQEISPDLYLQHSQNPDKRFDSIQFWIAVRKLTNARDEKNFEELANFALRAFSLPISNAVVERIFSIMNIVKSKHRNKMTLDMLEAILRIRVHLKALKKCCYDYQPSDKMLSLFNNDMYKQFKEKETNLESELAFSEAARLIESIE